MIVCRLRLWRFAGFAALALGVLATGGWAAESAADVAVICPTEFRQALEPWVAYRRRQGHRLTFVPNTLSADEIRSEIRRIAKSGSLRFVVLAGDADPGWNADAARRARSVPVHWAEAKVNVAWGSEPEIASDNWYADLDDDQTPDLAVGRLTADSPTELGRMVQKILDYEVEADCGAWRTRVNFVAGVGGFGPLADTALESGTKTLITDWIPAAYDTTMTYGSWRSPYCPDPREFQLTALRRLNEGCLFWVYIGHGNCRALDRARFPGREAPILSADDVPRLRHEGGSPIALLLACYTGAFDAGQDCLAEELLRAADGPAAVVCGSRVTMPYAMAVLGQELLREYFRTRRPTLGELLLHAKRNMLLRERNDDVSKMLDTVAAAISPKPADLKAERAEHLELFNLIGDPLLRLRYPREVELEVRPQAPAGGRLEVRGACPLAGQCTVSLVVRRDRLTFKPPRRAEYSEAPGTLDEYQRAYVRANDPRLVSTTLAVDGGRFRTVLAVPDDARGACHVRVFVEGERDFAAGAANVEIERKPPEEHVVAPTRRAAKRPAVRSSAGERP